MKKRVKIPVGNPVALLDLAKKVQSKHAADGDASPLKVLKWTDFNAMLEQAMESHEKAQKGKREMVEAFQQRDLKLQAITNALRDSRDVLSGVYKKEMKVLGQWGYEVLDMRSNVDQSNNEKVEAKA